MNGFLKQISLWIVVLIILVLLLTTFSTGRTGTEKLGLSDFESQLKADNIKSPVHVTKSEDLYGFKAEFKEK